MNIKSKEKKEHSTVELVIEVSREEFEAAIDKIYKKQRGSINVPGFRKGKAPRKIIEAMFGAGVFYEDAINELYPTAYAQAVEQEKLDAVAYPKVEIQEVGKDGFTFKALVTVRPEATLKAYKGLTAPKTEVKVTEADIDEELKPYISRATRLVSVKRKAKKGDTAVIDFEGFEGGVPFEGGKGENYSLELGSGSFVPGFETGVIGMKAGEEKDIELTFPQDYVPELAGKAVVFKVKVHEVKEPVAPELDDEFAKDVSEFDTLADLRKDLADKLAARRETQAKSEFERALTDQLIANLVADIPDAMVEYQADKMLEDYAMRITGQGIKFEDYLSMMGLTVDQLRLQAMETALRQVQTDLALEAVVAAEKLTISEEELEAEFKRLAEQYSMEVEQVKAAVPNADLEHDLLMKKAMAFVADNAKVGKAPAKKAAAKKSAKKDEDEPAAEEKPAKKPAKKAASKDETAAEEKPAKKPAAKKTTKKAEDEAAAEKKPAAKKKSTKKTEE